MCAQADAAGGAGAHGGSMDDRGPALAAHPPSSGSPQLPLLSGSRRVSTPERQRAHMLRELAKLGRGCASVADASLFGRYILLGVRARLLRAGLPAGGSCPLRTAWSCSAQALQALPSGRASLLLLW